MKKVLLLIVFSFIGMFVFAQGVDFQKLSLDKAIEKAKKEKKLVFVDCYTTWCGPCKMMTEQVFPQKEVGSYMNDKFICLKIDMEKGEGPALGNKYGVEAFPTFLIINPDGSLCHRFAGYSTADKFIDRLKDCFDPDKAEKRIHKTNRVKAGDMAPLFKYPDINGKEISLESLRGKYVLIDVWATWCTPCRDEIPHLKEMEMKFHGKNIVFVSISCDKDKGAWEKMVKEKEMTGIQLHAGMDMDLINSYKIEFIPRFILVDPEGKVVNVEMPKPSNPEMKKTLETLKGI